MSEDLSTLNLVELLDLLHPPAEPAAITLWPATPIWGALALLLGAGLALLGWRVYRSWQRQAPLRQARQAVLAADHDAAQIAEALRRAALAWYGRRGVAGLHGAAWLSFLERTGPARIPTETGQALIAAPWRPTPPRPDLTRAALAWLAHQPKMRS